MLTRILKFLGKTYTPDERIPFGLFLYISIQRLTWLLRGYLQAGTSVFIGPNTRLRGGRKIVFGRFATIESDCSIDGYAAKPVAIGRLSKIGSRSVVSCTSHFSRFGSGLTIGDNSGFGEFCYFGAAGGIEIGNNVIAGQYVSFHSENHIFDDPTRLIREQGVTPACIRIGNDVWIGAKATFLAGASVGDHSVVAAGAVVNGEFGPNSLIAGVPARVIREI